MGTLLVGNVTLCVGFDLRICKSCIGCLIGIVKHVDVLLQEFCINLTSLVYGHQLKSKSRLQSQWSN